MIISSCQVNAVLKSQFGPKNEKNSPCTARCPFIVESPRPDIDPRTIAKVKEVVIEGTEIRKDKVDSLKNMINQGNYPISGEAVAEKMVNRSLVDSILNLKENNK